MLLVTPVYLKKNKNQDNQIIKSAVKNTVSRL